MSSKNKFVQLALLHILSFALEWKVPAERLTKGLDIVIAGDNDFYSQRAKVSHILPTGL
jgi:phosphomevalonate kinase